MNRLEKLVSGIAVAGALSIGSPSIYAQETTTSNLSDVAQLEDHLRNFPSELGRVEFFPTEGATRILVHVRDLHSAEGMTSREEREVLQVQNNVYDILKHLGSKYEGVEVYCEGITPNHLTTLKDVANVFELIGYVKSYHPNQEKDLKGLLELEIARLQKEEPNSPGIALFRDIVTSNHKLKKMETQYNTALQFATMSASLKYRLEDQGTIHPADSESLLEAAVKTPEGTARDFIHEARESNALKVVSQGNASLPILLFGGNHSLVGRMRTTSYQNDSSNNLQALNDTLEKGDKFSLAVITPASYIAVDPEN